MGHVTELTDSNFTDEVADGVALVDFWAPWCGPCKIQLPILQKLAEALGNRAKIAKINVDENPDTAQQFKVQGIPTMVLLKNGAEIARFTGVTDQKRLQAAVEGAL
ncbi:MAG TPA: thioredoxin [Planctomycetota bacterium]|jgi:thioredoxin 1|nr:thioredoxin [Planctomycetota bacterium]OQC20532.1 MAG: Thioredoxin [Planctomycetes bacterium ADurb.Bin069]HNR97942.1 thioredoxin [Planctomycetota bacterium]HNU24532.1 thioredoxin [Planctomycetota bacterium]HOE29077.1 thioredoxin [Planctomycetota bacterium]